MTDESSFVFLLVVAKKGDRVSILVQDGRICYLLHDVQMSTDTNNIVWFGGKKRSGKVLVLFVIRLLVVDDTTDP